MATVVVLVLVCMLAYGLVALFVWRVAKHVVRPDAGGLGVPERLKAENDVRTSLLQSVTGLVVVAGLAVTVLQVSATQEQVSAAQEAAQNTFQVTQEQLQGQRFQDAVAGLGSDRALDQLGAVLLLRRLVIPDTRFRRVAFDALVAYVRHNLALDCVSGQSPQAAGDPAIDTALSAVLSPNLPRNPNLARLDLSGAKLHGTDLANVSFFGTDLSDANLTKAKLRDASFVEANLAGAKLGGAGGLQDAALSKMVANTETSWPGSFDPRQHDIIMDAKWTCPTT